MAEDIVRSYKEQIGLYANLAPHLQRLVEDLLRIEGLHVHSVSKPRVKTSDSLHKKVERSPEKYTRLEQITDLLGVRVITFFPSDVDKIAAIIEREFDIDWDNSVDRRVTLEPDRFGYLSLHYVARLSPARLGLTEYAKFAHCTFEIQIRSILQHAWAEIEHDLGYKSPEAIPTAIRRRFSRLAGLLEVADSEFENIRNDLRFYRGQLDERIKDRPTDVLLDKDSLLAFLQLNPLVSKVDRELCERLEGTIEYEDPTNTVDAYVAKLQFAGVHSIEELHDVLNSRSDDIVAFAETWLGDRRLGAVSAGISLFYLSYLLVGAKNSVPLATKYLDTFSIGTAAERQGLAESIVEIAARFLR